MGRSQEGMDHGNRQVHDELARLPGRLQCVIYVADAEWTAHAWLGDAGLGKL